MYSIWIARLFLLFSKCKSVMIFDDDNFRETLLASGVHWLFLELLCFFGVRYFVCIALSYGYLQGDDPA